MAKPMMTALTDISIEGLGNYQSILLLKINTQANEHGTLICRLRLEEDEIFVNEDDRTGSRIRVQDNCGQVLFCGICTNSRIQKMSAYAELEIIGKSLTFETDKEPKSRTFQDNAKTLQDILDEVMSEYGAVITVGNNMQIPAIIVQDNETDWRFAVRIANQYGLDIYSNTSADNIVIQAGTNTSKSVELGDNSILLEESKNLEEMRAVSSNEEGDFNTCQFTGKKVQTFNPSVMAGNSVGDEIIRNSSIVSENGVLVSKVDLQRESDSRSTYQSASQSILETRILTGEVIEVNGTTVKVKFDVDDSQDKATAQELPYETVFNNSFYCMPDEKDKVFAYVDNMGEAVILGSIRSDCSDPFFENPVDKAITSLDNMVRFCMDSLELTANRESGTKNEISKVSIELDNQEGVNIHATGSIVLRSLQDIFLISTYESGVDIQKIIETILSNAEDRCEEAGEKYDDANGDVNAYCKKVKHWYSDGVKDFAGDVGNSFVDFGKLLVLYDLWGNKNEVTVNDESETHDTGTVQIYGDNIKLTSGQSIMYLGLEGNSVIYINADVLNWMGLDRNTGYEIVSNSVKSGWDTFLDFLTVGLDIAATVCLFVAAAPVAATAAGIAATGAVLLIGASAVTSLCRGDYAGALLTAIPICGLVGKGEEIIKNSTKAAKIYTISTAVVCTWVRIAGGINQAKGLILGYQSLDDLDGYEKTLLLLQTIDVLLGVAESGYEMHKINAKSSKPGSPDVDNPQHIDSDNNTTKTKTTTADPVDVVTGGLTVEYTDLIVPDIRNDFRLKRVYNSTSMKREGILGRYWKYNIESHAQIFGDYIEIILPDMHAEKFMYKEGSWENSRRNRQLYSLYEENDCYILKDETESIIYTYDRTDGNLLSEEDRCGNLTRYTYEGTKVKQILLASGLKISFTYDGDRLALIEDSARRKCTFKYKDGLLVEENGPNGGQVTYEYTNEGYLTQITNEAGKCYVHNQYDRRGRVTRQQTADGEEYIFMYNDVDRQNTVTTMSNGRRVTYCYNRENLVWKTIYTDGTEEIKEYDANECVIMEKDRCGEATYRKYDDNGHLTKEELPSGLIVNYIYDTKGMLSEVVDNSGRTVKYERDARGNIICRSELIEKDIWAKYSYTYDAHGRLLSETDANGNTKTWEYDTLFQHPTLFKDSTGNEIHYELNEIGRKMATTSERGSIEYAYNSLGFVTAVTDEERNTTRYRYDVTGNKIAVIRPEQADQESSLAETYKYDAMDHLVEIKDELGNIRAMHVNSDGKTTKVIKPQSYDCEKNDGEGTVFLYDADGNRTDVCYPTGGIKKYLYDSCGRIVKVINPEEYEKDGENGAGLAYEYDAAGRLKQVTDTFGNIKNRYIYDLAGRVIKEIGSKGCNMAENDEERIGILYHYNLAGWLTEKRVPVEADSDRKTKYCLVKYAYDKCGNVVEEKRYLDAQSETSASGRVLIIRKEYDTENRLIKVSDSTGACVEYGYNAYNQKVTEKEKINNHICRLSKYGYGKNGWLSYIDRSADREGCGHTFARTSFRYDRNGNITEIKTPAGNLIRREYDAAGRLIIEEHEEKDGSIKNRTSFQYDRSGNLIRKEDDRGYSVTGKYDLRDRLIEQTDRSGGVTLISYDMNDQVVRKVSPKAYAKYGADAKGNRWYYDTEGRCIRSTHADGTTEMEYSYNSYGETESVKDAAGGGAVFTYDFGGRRISARTYGGVEQQTVYDARGNVIAVTDSYGKKTSFGLDPWGRVSEVMKADGSNEHYVYDFAGNIIEATDGEGNAVKYTYNTLNRLASRTDASGATESWLYDIEGNVYSHTDRRGIKVFHKYNMYHNLTDRCESGGGQTERWGYYPDGTLAYAEGGGRRYDYSYYPSGLLKEKRCGNRRLLGYEYDLDGNVIAMSDHTGKRVHYVYDDCDLLTGVLDGDTYLAEYSYYPDHTRKSLKVGSDLYTEYGYDIDKNLESLYTYIGCAEKSDARQVLSDNKYAYDSNGRLITKETLDGTTRYSYNEVNALVKVEYPDYGETFEYDRAGNRTGHTFGDTKERYRYDACNRLIEKTTQSGTSPMTSEVYEYDCAGNLIKDGRAAYSYDGLNRNIRTEMASGDEQVNRYDAEGLRYELEENGRIASFVFAGRDVVTKTDAEGHVTRFLHGYEILSCDSERARTYYHYACDELGSITHVVSGGGEDSAGSLSDDRVLNRYRYDAFGTTVSCEETVENCFRYTGGQYDPITEQYYLKARFYNPAVARFTQEDTYYGDGLNLYAYCHNNPVSYVDPTGHEAKAAAEKNPGSTSQRTPDQQALYNLVDEQNKLGGHDSTDQKTIRDWADEYGVDYDDLGIKPYESGSETNIDGAINNGQPLNNHRIVPDTDASSLPATKQTPNSSADLLNPDGSVKQRRYYGADGKAQMDIDFNHTDDGTHEFPHIHIWDWSKKPPRQDSRN